MALFRKNKNSGLVQSPGKQRLTLAEIATTGGSGRVRDISQSLWFPAGQPVPSVAPKGTPPRRYAYQPLTNYNFSNSRDGAVNFWTLRQFSYYTIVRAIIESVLDRLCSTKWDFRVIQEIGEKQSKYKARNENDPRLAALRQFFKKPDGWQSFRTWSRGLYDDMLVIDAASVWKQREATSGKPGPIASLVQIDGSTVFPLVDDTGQQPDSGRNLVQTSNKKATRDYLNKKKTKDAQGGSPAFQLTPYGFPAQEMTGAELTYAVRNRKTYRRYGFSIVEQALAMIALGLGRQDFQAAYYKSGNVPEFIAFLPPDCPVSKAEELNGYLDSVLSGQLGNRRKGFFLPSYGSEKSPNIVFPKANEEVLKDTFDEWIARVLCYFFGMSPTAFIKQVNRATAESSSQESEEQGLQPFQDWFKDTLDDIIQSPDGFGMADVEAVTESRKEQDATKQAEVDKTYVSIGVKTINQVREQNGDDPYPNCPEAYQPMIITATGAVPVGVDQQVKQQQSKISAGVIADPTEPATPAFGGGKKPAGKPGSKKKSLALKSDDHDSRLDWPSLSLGILSTRTHAARVHTELEIQKCFKACRDAAIRGISGILARPAKKASPKLSSVQFNLSPTDADKLLSIPIDEGDLAAKGRETKPHVTVLFGFDDISKDEINEAIGKVGQIQATLGDLIAFPVNEGVVPLVVELDSEPLHDLHEALSMIPNHDSHPVYKPHVTVAYLKEGTEGKYLAAGNPHKGHIAVLSDLVLSNKDRSMTPVGKVRKDDDDQDEMADSMYDAAVPYLERLPIDIRQSYEDAALSGVQQAVLDIGIDDIDLISSVNQQASDWARARAAELVGMAYDDEGNLVTNPDAKWAISDTTRDQLRQIVKEAFLGNTNKADILGAIKTAIQDERVFSDARAANIAKTEIGRAQMGSSLDVWKRSGVVSRLKWETTGDNPCVYCLLNSDEEVDFGDPFPNGAYSILDSHPNCVTGDSEIFSLEPPTKVFKRWFHGEAVTISIASGENLTITPNHPVLTDGGWIAARLLQKGMKLAHRAAPRKASLLVAPHDNLMPTRIEDVASALVKAGRVATASVPLSTEDFHGDGLADQEVNVVFSNRFLELELKTCETEDARKVHFCETHARRLGLPALGSPDELSHRVLFSANGSVGSFDTGLPSASIAEADGFGNIACLQAESQPAPVENYPRAAHAFAELQNSLPGEMEFVEITKLAIGELSAHVYNLETECGYYIANGIVVHNCNCLIRAVGFNV